MRAPPPLQTTLLTHSGVLKNSSNRTLKLNGPLISSKCPQSSKKFKGHFSGPSHPSNPSNPSHPSHPSHQTRPSASLCRCSHWTPEGHCGCLVDFLSTTPNSMIFKITTGTCVLKTNFYTHKKKSHVPALILKF